MTFQNNNSNNELYNNSLWISDINNSNFKGAKGKLGNTIITSLPVKQCSVFQK